MMFILRDMVSGETKGEPFNSSPFKWHGTEDECRTQLAHGLEYKPGSVVLQRVFSIVDLAQTGEGSIVTHGNLEFDQENDRYTRSVVLSKSDRDIYNEDRAWIRVRKDGYRSAVLALKGHPNGDYTDGIGFVLDAILSEMVARGASVTQEFAEIIEAIATVKQANPKQ